MLAGKDWKDFQSCLHHFCKLFFEQKQNQSQRMADLASVSWPHQKKSQAKKEESLSKKVSDGIQMDPRSRSKKSGGPTNT
jgi:hypothetical protein